MEKKLTIKIVVTEKNNLMILVSSKKQNKIIARKWLDLVSQGNVEAVCELTSPTWTMNGGLPGLPAGPEGIRKLFESFGPVEQHWTVNDIIAENDKVVVRATNNCMQERFLGIPGSGKRQIFTAIFIHRILDGKIQQTWRNADDLGRLLQIGAEIAPARQGN
jgi:predicted ester cyclase